MTEAEEVIMPLPSIHLVHVQNQVSRISFEYFFDCIEKYVFDVR